MPKFLKNFLLISLLIGVFTVFLLTKPKSTIAFSVVGNVITYDVMHDKFYSVWQADGLSGTIVDVNVSVYTSSDGTGLVSGITTTNNIWKDSGSYNYVNTMGWRFDNTGLMGVKVSGLDQVNTQYYYKITVHENIGGTISYHDIPSGANDFIPVHTMFDESSNTGASGNPVRQFKVYDESGNPLDGAIVLIQVTGDYWDPTSANPSKYSPYSVAGDSMSGWTFDGGKSNVSFSGGTLFKESPVYRLMVIQGDEMMRVTCLGGYMGNATIDIAQHDNYNNHQAEFGCPSYPNDPSSCSANSDRNIINLAPNQAPDISITDDHSMRFLNNQYVLLDTENFELDVRASDAEGEAISNWALTSEPGGMTITEQSDANYSKIEWDPGSGDVRSTPYSVSVTVQDINENTGSLPFTILITDGKPSDPAVSVTPAVPRTGDPLVCGITTGSTDPLGLSITYEYAWYEDTGLRADITGNTVPSGETEKGEDWYCSVKAVNSNSDESGAVNSNTVTVVNTPPTADITVTINQSNPDTDTDLTANIVLTNCYDADGDSCNTQIKWYESGDPGTSYSTTDSLAHSNTSKNQTWYCEATVWDSEEGTGTGSDSVTIINLPPSDPAGIGIERGAGGSGIRCYINTSSTDPDTGDNPVTYLYNWTCTGPGANTGQTSSTNTEYTLSDTGNPIADVAKNQVWTCSVQASDMDTGNPGLSAIVPCAGSLTILNTKPIWDISDPLTLTPDPAYNDTEIICTMAANAASDADADTVVYTYQWYKDNGSMASYRDANTSSLTSTLPVSAGLEQAATYKCEVSLWDGQEAGNDIKSASVTIGNRPPTITVRKGSVVIGDGEMVQVTETEELVLTIVSDDADNNALSSLDADANIPTVAVNGGAVIQIVGDPNEAEFTWTPAQGDAGTYEVVFKVQETDGPDSLETTHSVQIKVIYPSKVIDNFEFQSEPDPDWYLPANDAEKDLEERSDHGWSVLTGSGDIYRESYENDPNDHYLNMVSNESDPLKYITTLWLADPNETKDFYEVRCDIDTNSPYTVEAYVHVVDTVSGVEKDYFLRYIPEDPSQHDGNKFEVDAMRINYYIGSEFIDPNGCSLERNMENDIHNAIAAKGKQYQSHYDFVWGFILRGGIDKFDNLEVVYGERDTVSPKPPQTGSAVGINEAVVLTWEDDPNQDADVIGYEIAWQKDEGQTYTPQKVYVWEEGISGEVKSCTIPFAENYPGGHYLFTIKAFDDAKEANYSSALELQATPHIDSNPPDMEECDLTAQAPETQGETINLAWTDPGAANLSYFILYMDGTEIATLDKSVFTYQKTGLVNDTQYEFKLKGYNGDGYGSGVDSPEATGIPMAPKVLVFDDFEYVAQSQTPMQHGWKVLQGSGNMYAVEEDGNSCMHMTANYTTTAKTNFIITKFVDDPEDYTNTKLYFNLKGLVGEFKIDLFISDTNGNRYFLRYSPNATYNEPKPDPCKVGMYITHYLDWRNNNGTVWHPVVRDLQKDLQDGVPGATFGSFLGMVIRGEVFIGHIIFMRALPEVGSLVAISGNTLVDLFWTRTDPNVDDFYLSVDGAADVLIDSATHSLLIDGNQCSCTADGLTNDTAYSFTVKQGNSSGVTVSATPHDFVFVEDCDSLGDWTDQGSTLGSYSIVVDPETHDDVLVIDPDDTAASGYLIRYFVELVPNITTGKSKVMVNIKSGQDFVLWFTVKDTIGVEYNLLYASGQGTDSAFGTWSFSYLPSCADGNWIDGSWHTVDLELNDNLLLSGVQGYGVQVDEITNVSIGGCDDVSVDNLSVY